MKRLRIIIITLFLISLTGSCFAFDFDFEKQMRDLRSLAGNSLSSGISALQGASSYFNKNIFAYTPFGLASSAASYFGTALTSYKISFPAIPNLSIPSFNSLGSYLNKNIYPYTPLGLAGSTASYLGNALTNYKITLPAIPKLTLPSFDSSGSTFDTALRLTNQSVNIIRTVPLVANPLSFPVLLATKTFSQYLPNAIQTWRGLGKIDLSKVDFNSMYRSTQDAWYKLSAMGNYISSSIDWSHPISTFRSVGENLVFHQANFLDLHYNYALDRFRSNYLE